MIGHALAASQNLGRKPFGAMALRGLGFTYYDLLGASGMENCDPRDTSCVMRNTQRSTAVEDLWATQYMTNPNTANLPTPTISINTVDTSASNNQFLNNQPMTSQVITVQGQGSATVQSLETGGRLTQPNQQVTPTVQAVNSIPASSHGVPGSGDMSAISDMLSSGWLSKSTTIGSWPISNLTLLAGGVLAAIVVLKKV